MAMIMGVVMKKPTVVPKTTAAATLGDMNIALINTFMFHFCKTSPLKCNIANYYTTIGTGRQRVFT